VERRGPCTGGGRARRALSLVLACAGAGAAVVAHADGDVLVAIAEAPRVVVAEVQGVEALVHAGYRATLDVERSLEPEVPSPGSLTVAWEEPAPSMPPRLVAGRRILLALAPLPTASIWAARVPDPEARGELLAIAGDGAGYLVRPSMAELDVLEHYRRVGAEARSGDAGVLHLSRLCAVAQPRLAAAATAALDAFPGLADHVTPGAAVALVDALLREDVPAVRDRLLETIGRTRPEALRGPLLARLRAAGDAPPAVLYAALGALDGGLADDTALPLLASPAVDTRVAAARHASGPRARSVLRTMLRDDPAPAVRAAAVSRLVTVDGEAALPDATRALEDSAPEVRLAAARASARLDPEAVGPLRDVALHGPADAARAALAALSLMGEEAHLILAELAAEHPDPGMRTLAGIAVGQPIGDRH
jgi:hypothetical protein